MSTPTLEAYLARLYTDPAALDRFEADPQGEAMRAGLSPLECEAMVRCDRVGLRMAATSFARKRAKHPTHRALPLRILDRLLRR